MFGEPPGGGNPLEIRASDAERRQVIDALQAACVDGRLSLDEYGQRVERAFAARNRADLSPLLGDLPPPPASADQRSTRVSSTLAVLGSAERSGFWRLAQAARVLALLGSCKLDLRAARISSVITRLQVRCVLGSVSIVVPTGVEVELEVHTILGSRNMRLASNPPAPGAPSIHITGLVLLGSLSVRDGGFAQQSLDLRI